VKIRPAVAAGAAVLAALLLTACDPPAPDPSGSPAPTSASGTPTPPGGSPSPGPDASEDPGESPGPDDEAVRANVRDAIGSGDTAALESWMHGSVQVILAASECCGTTDAAEAASIVHERFPSGSTTWDFSLDEGAVAVYRGGWYGEHFPVGAVVGRTVEEHPWVIALTISEGRVSRVFYGPEDVLP